MTGKPLSFFHSSTESLSDIYELITLKISLNDRNKLHTIIEERTKKMFDSGLIDEVKYLKDKYELDLSYQSMKAIGYSHVMNFLYGKLNEKDLLQKVIFSTRQLAKRQITWLKKFPSKYQLDNASNITKLIFNKIDKHLQYL